MTIKTSVEVNFSFLWKALKSFFQKKELILVFHDPKLLINGEKI